jgi:ribosomal-protein-alanine N-acetyltransferase
MPYTIRPMEPGDISMVIAIERLSFPTPWPASAFLYELRQTDSHYYVLLKSAAGRSASPERGWRHWLRRASGLPEEGQVIGYVGFRFQGDAVHISTIAVHPDRRGEGLGELLLLTAMERALRQRANRVTLEMRVSNDVARRLYHKYGFQLKGTLVKYYRDGENAQLMAVEINNGVYQIRLARLRRTLEARLHSQQIDVGQNQRVTL